MGKRVARPPPSRGERNIAWIEQHLIVPEGRDVGQPIRLREWQKQIIRGIYDTPTRRAIISMGRKNGKSALAAMLLLLNLVGPEARRNGQIYSAAQSRDQAAILFALAAKMVRQSPSLVKFVQVRDTAKQLLCPELGTMYRALSADASTALGLSPVLVLHDESGQIRGPRSPLYDAMETATAAHRDPLSIVLSTQAPTENDLLSILIDDAKTGADPKVKLFLYTAPDDLDPFSDEAIRAANPAAGDFANMDEMRAMANDARRMPARQSEFENLVLNRRVEIINPYISKSVWDENAGSVVDSFTGYPVYGGLDLSETADLSALVLVAQIAGVWHVKPTFWLPGEGLAEKARKDRVPYDLWHQQGYLQTTPGRAVEYGFIAAYLHTLFDQLDIRKIGFDRYNMRHLVPWMRQAGMSDHLIGERMADFGQGFVSMSPALRETETILLNNKLCHGGHPVLAMCAANAVTTADPAGNRKLDKARARGRIDGMVALAMALSVATVGAAQPETVPYRSVWSVLGAEAA